MTLPADWTADDGLRIIRNPKLDFNHDEALQAHACDDEHLRSIVAHGYNGTWLRGKLRDLMASQVLPELNPDKAVRQKRIDAIASLIRRSRVHQVGTYLFFNEPLALLADDPFWQTHGELAGERFEMPHHGVNRTEVSLCLSHPTVAAFFSQAVASILRDLPGLAGVILITASEHHSHCWSHYARYGLDDGYVFPAAQPMGCTRCAKREPAELVGQIVTAWQQAAAAHNPACRVIAWNWSWSIWYPDPQRQVVDALPENTLVMADFERGGSRPWRDTTLKVDEYSLGYPGPSERFENTRIAAEARHLAVMAKLQIGTTHELASVPNLPLPASIHAKLASLYRHRVKGFLATWNFGCGLTLNTFAVRHFMNTSRNPRSPGNPRNPRNPGQMLDEEVFLHTLAQEYLGVTDTAAAARAWRGFSQAMQAYPFHIRMTYFGPANDAPAHPLSRVYRGSPLGGSWRAHEMGDRLEDCLGPFSMADAAWAFDALASGWTAAMVDYEQAMASVAADASDAQRKAAAQELACARMVALQWRSTANLFAFHHRRQQLMAEAPAAALPFTLPVDEVLLKLMRDEIENARKALPLVDADARLGYHQEAQCHMYDSRSIRQKINAMEAELASAESR